jgi:hypothetical protein
MFRVFRKDLQRRHVRMLALLLSVSLRRAEPLCRSRSYPKATFLRCANASARVRTSRPHLRQSPVALGSWPIRISPCHRQCGQSCLEQQRHKTSTSSPHTVAGRTPLKSATHGIFACSQIKSVWPSHKPHRPFGRPRASASWAYRWPFSNSQRVVSGITIPRSSRRFAAFWRGCRPPLLAVPQARQT